MREIIIYTQPGWIFCNRTKEFLSNARIQYREIDITSNAEAMKELERMNIMATPVIKYGDQVILGFDKIKLEKLLPLVKAGK